MPGTLGTITSRQLYGMICPHSKYVQAVRYLTCDPEFTIQYGSAQNYLSVENLLFLYHFGLLCRLQWLVYTHIICCQCECCCAVVVWGTPRYVLVLLRISTRTCCKDSGTSTLHHRMLRLQRSTAAGTHMARTQGRVLYNMLLYWNFAKDCFQCRVLKSPVVSKVEPGRNASVHFVM